MHNHSLCAFLVVLLTVSVVVSSIAVYSHEKYETYKDVRQIDVLEDPMFSNVVVYNNDSWLGITDADGRSRSGLLKCINNCNGRCVEFGVTGMAFCYPPYTSSR